MRSVLVRVENQQTLTRCHVQGTTMARARGPLQLARQTRPWTLGAGRWSDALKQIASTEETKLPESVLIDADAHTYTIYDGYPKAQFHFLILPRLPLVYDEPLENGKRRRVQIHERELDSISSVLASRHASFILGCLERASERVGPAPTCSYSCVSAFVHRCKRS